MADRRMTDEERIDRTRQVVADALAAMRRDDHAEGNQLFGHAVHEGMQPVELAAEIIAQTGGRL